MKEEFEKILMIQVRGQQLINWLSALEEILHIPFEEYSRFHRKIFSILIVELLNDGLKYVSKQKEFYEKNHSRYLCGFFTIIYNGVLMLKEALSEDEYIFLYHLRNCAGHIFQVGYDYVDLEGNVKSNLDVTVQTKSGRQKMPLEELDGRLKRVCLQYGINDTLFLKHIYNLSNENLSEMFVEFHKYQHDHLII